jgi:hypothetical protein
MLAIYATAILITFASLVAGMALMKLLGRERPTWLAAATGFAALTIAATILIRLPGRATTAAILLALALVAAAAYVWGWRRGSGPAAERSQGASHGVALTVAIVVLAAGSLPFLFNDATGPLGEGIYTNDQAAQLFWTDWLQNGIGPEPSAVRFGYPTGPQSVTAVAAEGTGASLEDAFNGLLLAIAVLTALTALAALEALPPLRRTAAASLAGLPYLAASFLAQSAFKETAMALLVLGSAIALGELGREGARRWSLGVLAILAAGAVMTYNIPGLAWLALAIPIWALLEARARRSVGGTRRTSAAGLRGRRDAWMQSVRRGLPTGRLAWLGFTSGAVIVIGIAVLSAGQVSSFFDKLGQVQGSPGRLSSPVFPGEALGVWPEGDFQLVRGDVSGAIPAALFGLVACGLGGIAALRRRDNGLASMLAAAIAVYVGARLFASIYVEAKALAVMSPLVMVVALRTLLARNGSWRFVLGAAFAAAAVVSTLLALRAAPVGFDQRGRELESLAQRVGERPVVFLGVDRFAGYWLRGTLVRSPGGYVPPEVHARPEKVWQQGTAMDLDTLAPTRLDDFDFAITTRAAYQSTPPPGMEPIRRTESYVLWQRTGEIPETQVLGADATTGNEGPEDGAAGAVLDCNEAGAQRIASGPGAATVFAVNPVVIPPYTWKDAAHFDAPGEASKGIALDPGRWRLSLQYHSQVPLTVSTSGGEVATLPPSLDGMYQTDFLPDHPQDSFWPAGQIRVPEDARTTRMTVHAAAPNGLQDALGVRRQVWLGELAATRPADPRQVPLADACGAYVDHFETRPTPK